MGGINWRIRIKNKAFWCFMIPVVFLLIQQILAVFGIVTDFTDLENQLVAIVGTVFTILAACGIVVDPTTPSWSDSDRARGYDEPGVNYDEFDSDVADLEDEDFEDDEEIESEEIE